MLNSAKQYAARGWQVLCLHGITPSGGCTCGRRTCTSPGKHPRTLHGVKDSTENIALIETWWNLWPDSNIGIAAGRDSDLVVIDIDPRNGGRESAKELIDKHGRFPHTVVALTGGGGLHYMFGYPATPGIGKRVLATGIDLVSDGGYVVVAPSRHVSGNVYRWQGGRDPVRVSLCALPLWVLECGVKAYTPSDGFAVGRFVPEGGRNDHFSRIAGAMRRWGLSVRAIEAALEIHNYEVCDPPMSLREVGAIAASVGRYEPEEHGEAKPPEGRGVRIEDCSMDEGVDGS